VGSAFLLWEFAVFYALIRQHALKVVHMMGESLWKINHLTPELAKGYVVVATTPCINGRLAVCIWVKKSLNLVSHLLTSAPQALSIPANNALGWIFKGALSAFFVLMHYKIHL
jgi:hypothetical protein